MRFFDRRIDREKVEFREEERVLGVVRLRGDRVRLSVDLYDVGVRVRFVVYLCRFLGLVYKLEFFRKFSER